MTRSPSTRHLVVAMPAYNEADGLPEFLAELHTHLSPIADKLTFVIADDCSTDNTVSAIASLVEIPTVIVEQEQNRGHGSTALLAYRTALDLAPDVLVHVDGDGQFRARDIVRVISALSPDVDVVYGVRVHRTDPWFRVLLTALVHGVMRCTAGTTVSDVNTPLRAYRPETAGLLIRALGQDAQIPHVHFSIAGARWKLPTAEVRVKSIPRRGASATGTMWGKTSRPRIPSRRLWRFVGAATKELWRVSLRPGAPMRRVPS